MKKLFTIAFCALLAAVAAEAKTYYVNAKRPNNNGNGLKLKTAKKTIQAAINIAKNGDTIIVYPGTYAPIKTNNKKINIKSPKGASMTTIAKPAKKKDIALAQLGKAWKKSYWDSYGNKHYYSSVPETKGKNTTLTGFLLDGKNRDNGDHRLLGISGGKAKACTVQRLFSYATVAVNASLTACTLKANAGLVAENAEFNRCNVTENKGNWQLVTDSQFCNCLVVGNSTRGPLFAQSVLLNCTIARNAVTFDVSESTCQFSQKSKYYNCILRNNTSSRTEWTWVEVEGYWDEDDNWIAGTPGTVVGFYDVDGWWHLGQPGKDDGYTDDAGVWQPYAAQTRTAGYFDEYAQYWEYQFTTKTEEKEIEHAKKIHNVDSGNKYYCTLKKNNNPKFVDEAKGNYKLAKGSPCINKGKLTAAQKKQLGSRDLAGGKRIKGKAIDRGCYEY